MASGPRHDRVIEQVLRQVQRDFPGWEFERDDNGWKATAVVRASSIAALTSKIVPLSPRVVTSNSASDHVVLPSSKPQTDCVDQTAFNSSDAVAEQTIATTATDSSPTGPGSTFDPSTAAPSRTYASLRGVHNDALAADRQAVNELGKAVDGVHVVVQENAAALVRVVDFLAREHDVFADLGGGRPVQGLDARKLPDLVQVAARHQPKLRWLLLDSDITVITAGRAILGGLPGVVVEQEDLRHPAAVLDKLAKHLGRDRPIVVILGAVLHFLTDGQAADLMAALWGHLAPGSVVVATHATSTGVDPETVAKGTAAYQANHGICIYPRTEEEIAALAGRFAITEPGVVRTIDFMQPDPAGTSPVQAPHFLMWMAERRPNNES